jgi:hypothetical protein
MCSEEGGSDQRIPQNVLDVVESQDPIEDGMWAKIGDAHCHPTDAREQIDAIASMKTSKFCTMSTRINDQELVAEIAEIYSDRVVPCFGWKLH